MIQSLKSFFYRNKKSLVNLAILSLTIILIIYLYYLFFIRPTFSLSNLVGVITILISIWELLFSQHAKSAKLNIPLEQYGTFVNREQELENLLTCTIDNKKNICVHGQSGIGKTYLLKRYVNIVNRNNTDYKLKKKISLSTKAFYFSLSTSEEIEETVKRMMRKNLHLNENKFDEIECIPELLSKVGCRCPIFVFDNVSTGKIEDLNRVMNSLNTNGCLFIYAFQQEMSPYDFQYLSVDLSEKLFSEIEIIKLGEMKKKIIDNHTAKKIKELSKGLPAFVDILLKDSISIEKVAESKTIRSYFEKKISSLSEYRNDLLYLVTLGRDYELIELGKLSISPSQVALEKLSEEFLIQYFPNDNTVLIHEIIEDMLAKIFEDSYTSSYREYHFYCYKSEFQENSRKKLIHLLSCSASVINDNIKEFKNYFQKLIAADDYTALIQVYNIFNNHSEKDTISSNVSDYLYYGQFFSLLGIGEYVEAERFYNSLTIEDIVLAEQTEYTPLKFEFQYKYFDFLHLKNSFKESVESLERLASKLEKYKNEPDFTEKNFFSIFKLTNKWTINHIKGHLGKDMISVANGYHDIKLEAFAMGKSCLGLTIKATYGEMTARLVLHDMNFDYSSTYIEIQSLVKKDPQTHQHLEYRANRHMSMYYRKIGNTEKSEQLLKESIEYFEKHTHRIKYDFYFALGDLYRQLGRFEDSKELIDKAAAFAERVNDRNLLIYSNLCLIMIEAQSQNLSEKRRDLLLDKLNVLTEEAKLLGLYLHEIHIELVRYSIQKRDNKKSYSSFLENLEQRNLHLEYKLAKQGLSIEQLEKLHLIVR